ncbi:SMC-Scp complex subunit ScpB [Candidatus Woesearchaeota archaeon]|nr:SMC-Scp complex subunit ScpB [Candidatus Woesearchaeota archaeon]
MQEDKNKVETVLFTIGRFIELEELGKLCGMGSIGYLKDVLQELKKDYDVRSSALEIVEQGERWKLNIKRNYLYLTENLLTDSELDRPTQETLAIIAYKNPVSQSEIIKIRGNGAYDHVKLLKEFGFIVSEPMGRTRILKLTTKFYDYFDVVENQLRSKIQTIFGSEVNTNTNDSSTQTQNQE